MFRVKMYRVKPLRRKGWGFVIFKKVGAIWPQSPLIKNDEAGSLV